MSSVSGMRQWHPAVHHYYQRHICHRNPPVPTGRWSDRQTDRLMADREINSHSTCKINYYACLIAWLSDQAFINQKKKKQKSLVWPPVPWSLSHHHHHQQNCTVVSRPPHMCHPHPTCATCRGNTEWVRCTCGISHSVCCITPLINWNFQLLHRRDNYYTPSRPVVPLAAEWWRSCSARELPVDLQAHLLPTQQTHELCSWSHRVRTVPKGVKG